MIRIPMPQEPDCFDATVRQRGLDFLQRQGQDPQQKPKSSSRIWGSGAGNFWTAVKDDLRTGYNNRCVYSCFVLEDERQPNGKLRHSHSIDHFQPRSCSPAYLAYEWSNLRWAWQVIDNEGKKNHLIPEKYDPTRLTHKVVELQEDDDEDWIVVPNSSLTDLEQKEIKNTIQNLGLNRKKVKVRRRQYVEDFLENKCRYDANFMKERQPFIYCELKRLGWL
ncbi:hypothetical protein [Candidatus Synechococcus spongiarum]|uniref:HNH nuclease domain-containing protein n=1 Tax=Candidatus Synechococcus spongiarum TaxID=431041 RepID=A0A164Y3J8_9SYNE|nr:hypothetical protein [Candidatus Synechococcus spongiarum]SAY38825.1 hypothetical protein FLM9_861 [Candidatus Synechococcus spongiarum]